MGILFKFCRYYKAMCLKSLSIKIKKTTCSVRSMFILDSNLQFIAIKYLMKLNHCSNTL